MNQEETVVGISVWETASIGRRESEHAGPGRLPGSDPREQTDPRDAVAGRNQRSDLRGLAAASFSSSC